MKMRRVILTPLLAAVAMLMVGHAWGKHSANKWWAARPPIVVYETSGNIASTSVACWSFIPSSAGVTGYTTSGVISNSQGWGPITTKP